MVTIPANAKQNFESVMTKTTTAATMSRKQTAGTLRTAKIQSSAKDLIPPQKTTMLVKTKQTKKANEQPRAKSARPPN